MPFIKDMNTVFFFESQTNYECAREAERAGERVKRDEGGLFHSLSVNCQ